MSEPIRYFISNPAPKVWRVYKREDYDAIWNKYDITAWFNDPVVNKEASEAERKVQIAEFPTRREARAYVESIGGTWK